MLTNGAVTSRIEKKVNLILVGGLILTPSVFLMPQNTFFVILHIPSVVILENDIKMTEQEGLQEGHVDIFWTLLVTTQVNIAKPQTSIVPKIKCLTVLIF